VADRLENVETALFESAEIMLLENPETVVYESIPR